MIVASLLSLTSCTTESWYQGAKSAQTTHCMKEPVSEYEECIKQADENYLDYSKKRQQLLEDNLPDKAD